jgi:hypothetical protein
VPLRSPDLVGLPDVRDLTREDGAGSINRAPRERVKPTRPARAASRPGKPREKRTPSDQDEVRVGAAAVASLSPPSPGIPLGDEPTRFVQVMVAGEVHERLTQATFDLALEHPKLRHQKTVLGAVLWRHVDHLSPDRVRDAGVLLDAFADGPFADAPTPIKVGAHVPFSLKRRLDGTVLALRRTHRDASAKALLSALVLEHVDTADAPSLRALVELLVAYHAELNPPRTVRSSAA